MPCIYRLNAINNKNMNSFIIVSKFCHNDAQTCCKFFQMTLTRAIIFILFIVFCLKICFILHKFINETTCLTYFSLFCDPKYKKNGLKNLWSQIYMQFQEFLDYFRNSGVKTQVQEFRKYEFAYKCIY